MDNLSIARVFDIVADLLEIQGANPFRIRAYRNAARTLESLGVPAATVARKGGLAELPGIGKDLAEKITTILETGKLPLLGELTAKLPASLVEMLRIPGLGPKRAKEIYDKLGVKTLTELEEAARSGRLRQLKGFKEKLENTILEGLAAAKARGGRVRLYEADAHTRPLVAYLKAISGVGRIEVAGSYRRRRETVGDVDILVSTTKPATVAKRFLAYPGVAQVLAQGPTRCSIVLAEGLQADLRIVPARSYGAALHYFTGSKAHNIAIRTLGVKRGLKINEYGVFRGERRLGGREEKEVFEAVGLPWIPPELREDQGEIDAARDGRLPRLVEVGDIRGDLQMHTTYSDGKQDVATMADAARRRGYEYIAITDHTKAVRVAGGLDAAGFRRQFREIDALAGKVRGLTVLKSAEVDILEDGRLDLDAATLGELDVVVASVHSKFNMTKAAMTRRIVKALGHPRVQILAHPTGRLIGRREPYPLDFEQIVRVALKEGVALEVNAQPHRLDINDVQIKMARDAGVKLVVSTDAHRVEELDYMRCGVDQARRGWCEAGDILNTRPLASFLAALRR